MKLAQIELILDVLKQDIVSTYQKHKNNSYNYNNEVWYSIFSQRFQNYITSIQKEQAELRSYISKQNNLEITPKQDIDYGFHLFNQFVEKNPILMEVIRQSNLSEKEYFEVWEKLVFPQENLTVYLSEQNTIHLFETENSKQIQIDNCDLLASKLEFTTNNSREINAYYNANTSSNQTQKTILDSSILSIVENELFEDDEFNEQLDNLLQLETFTQTNLKQRFVVMIAHYISELSYQVSLPFKANLENPHINPLIQQENNNANDQTSITKEMVKYGYLADGLIKKKKVQTEQKQTKIDYLTCGRFYKRILGLDTNSLKCKNAINLYQAYAGAIELRFAANDQADLWTTIYNSPNMTSCMKSELGIEIIQSYATSSPCWANKDGQRQDDNGLILCYFNTPEQAEGRAIVNLKTKEYVSTYGDVETLKYLLNKNGIRQCYEALLNVPIVVTKTNDGKTLGPYLDGSVSYAYEIDSNYSSDENKIVINITDDSRYAEFQLTESNCEVIDFSKQFKCACCQVIYSRSEVNPFEVYHIENYDIVETPEEVCKEDCIDEVHYHKVYDGRKTYIVNNLSEAIRDGQVICPKGSDEFFLNNNFTIKCHELHYSEHHQEWYCGDNDIELVDGDYYEKDLVEHSDYQGENILIENAVWSNYHNSYLSEDNAVCSDPMNDYIAESEAVNVNGEFFPDAILELNDGYYTISSSGLDYVSMSEEEALQYMKELQGIEIPEQQNENTYRP